MVVASRNKNKLKSNPIRNATRRRAIVYSQLTPIPPTPQPNPKSIKYPRASQVRLAADDRSLKGKKGTSNSKRACVYDQKPKLRICLGQGRSARVSPTTHPPCYPFTLSIKRVVLVVGGNSVVFNFSPSSGIFVTLFPPFQFTRLIESDKTRHQV